MAQSQRTLSQLITSIRQIANEETNNPEEAFITDTEIKDRVVEAQYELYDMMLDADQHLFVLSQNFTLTTASNNFALSTIADPGFYRFVALDYQTGGPVPATVNRFNFAERNRYRGNNFAGTYTLWYTPRLTELSALTDKLDVFADNYRAWIIHAVAAVIMAKAETSDPRAVLTFKATETARIMKSIAQRNNEPEQAPDVHSVESYWDTIGFQRAYSIEGPNLVIR